MPEIHFPQRDAWPLWQAICRSAAVAVGPRSERNDPVCAAGWRDLAIEMGFDTDQAEAAARTFVQVGFAALSDDELSLAEVGAHHGSQQHQAGRCAVG